MASQAYRNYESDDVIYEDPTTHQTEFSLKVPSTRRVAPGKPRLNLFFIFLSCILTATVLVLGIYNTTHLPGLCRTGSNDNRNPSDDNHPPSSAAIHLPGRFPTRNDDNHPPSSAPRGMCPTRYTPVDRYCYLINLPRGDFQQQKDFCFSTGGYLAVLTTQHENTQLTGYLRSFQLGPNNWALWIGLKDLVGDNKIFNWLMENTPVQYTNWLVANPSHPKWQCGVIIGNPKYGGSIGEWDDIYCEFILGAVCEADPIN